MEIRDEVSGLGFGVGFRLEGLDLRVWRLGSDVEV